MTEKQYDLAERTFQFALSVRKCLSGAEWSRVQFRDVDQLLRSSGSVAANYVEANNADSRADFIHRIRIAKKEACESQLWIRFLGATSTEEAPKVGSDPGHHRAQISWTVVTPFEFRA